MEKGTTKAKRELAAKQLYKVWEMFEEAFGVLYKCAEVYPALEDYAENVWAHVEVGQYGIGRIHNVIFRLKDLDQKEPSADDILEVL